MSLSLVGIAIVLAACSGVPALFLSRRSAAGQRLAVVLLVTASVLGMLGAGLALAGPAEPAVVVRALAGVPQLTLGVDLLSALFLLPVFLLAACASVYGLAYWPQQQHRADGRRVGLFLGLLTAALGLLLIAQDGIAFLFGWEVMALAAFFLVTTEEREAEVRAAGWLYFASTHLCTLVLFAFFALLQASTGAVSLLPDAAAAAIAPAPANALFVLALVGFGLKAGIVPLHFWLPSAHASAPSHVSAMMSGVMIKMGVYGLVRTCALLPAPPPWQGQLLLAVGAVSAFVGVAFAIGQHDLKRLLAYHSIENIGIIFLGLGLAMAGRSAQRLDWIVLGLGGALLHVWNHALFKALLFLAAGATIQGAGTRAIDQMGGIARTMPLTAAAFLCGAVAICGLPPLNGLVSELLVYLGLFAAVGSGTGLLLAPVTLAPLVVPVLAMVGGMALLCFVKVFGAVYLGQPRHQRTARESEAPILIAMAVLACCCTVIGLLPMRIAPLFDGAIAAWSHAAALPLLGELAPLGAVSALGFALVAMVLGGLWWLRRRRPAGGVVVGTWDCGYIAPTPAMQYTASSFGQQFVSLLRWLLLPLVKAKHRDGLFPAAAAFHSHVPDVVLDRAVLPVLRGCAQACLWLKHLQGGRVNLYLLYVFLTLLVLLLLK